MSHLPIWYLGKLDNEMCDQVVAEMSSSDLQDAAMGITGGDINKSTRNTSVKFAESNYWLADRFTDFAAEANQNCKWDYIVNGKENLQFAKYGPEQHYAWHTDIFTLSGAQTDRKVSVVCLLNDEFEGGEFELRLYQDYVVPLEKGTMIAFPSILEHRVKPVTSGLRCSATMWFYGPRFR
jgi:PKHD-type hydroxylase